MSKFMGDMPAEQAELTIKASKLNDMLGADAAEIGFNIARCAQDGSSVVKVYIDDDSKLPNPADDAYTNNGIRFSRYLDYVNNKRIAPSYFPFDDIEHVNKCDPDKFEDAQQGFAVPLNENWNMHYKEETNEIHIPAESTYIMDERDYASMAIGVLDSVVNKGNGRTTVVLDGYDQETYHHKASEALKRYHESASEILKDQKVAPFYRGDVVDFNITEW